MKKLLALVSLFSGPVTVLAQWGIRANLIEADATISSPHGPTLFNMGLGVDRDLGRAYTIGGDLFTTVHSDREFVNVPDHDGVGMSTFRRTAREYKFFVRASYLLSGSKKASWHVGPVAGLRFRQEELEPRASAVDAYRAMRLERWTVPVGVRLGFRDEMPRGYFDVFARLTYDIGGGEPLGQGMLIQHTRSELEATWPAWRLAVGASYGLCASGCDRESTRRMRVERRAWRRSLPVLAQERRQRWGVRLIVGELARDGYSRAPDMLMAYVVPITPYSGIGFDYDLSTRWWASVDALASWSTFGGRTRGGSVEVNDPTVVVQYQNGTSPGDGLTSEYQVSSSTTGLNLRANRRFVLTKRSSPYAGAFVGLRRERMTLRDPDNHYEGSTSVSMVGGPAEEFSIVKYRVPMGLRLGLDFRAGIMYCDLYLHASYELGGGGEYFGGPQEVSTDRHSGFLSSRASIAFRNDPFVYGGGFAIGVGRRVRLDAPPSN